MTVVKVLLNRGREAHLEAALACVRAAGIEAHGEQGDVKGTAQIIKVTVRVPEELGRWSVATFGSERPAERLGVLLHDMRQALRQSSSLEELSRTDWDAVVFEVDVSTPLYLLSGFVPIHGYSDLMSLDDLVGSLSSRNAKPLRARWSETADDFQVHTPDGWIYSRSQGREPARRLK